MFYASQKVCYQFTDSEGNKSERRTLKRGARDRRHLIGLRYRAPCEKINTLILKSATNGETHLEHELLVVVLKHLINPTVYFLVQAESAIQSESLFIYE